MTTLLSMNSVAFWLAIAGIWLNGVAFGGFVWVFLNRRINR